MLLLNNNSELAGISEALDFAGTDAGETLFGDVQAQEINRIVDRSS